MIKTIALLSSDKALGAFGGSLAVASLGFGIYMNIHGPAADFGKSGAFTVFAQLAPKHPRQPVPAATRMQKERPAEELDMTATASIPKPAPQARAAAAEPESTGAKAGHPKPGDPRIIAAATLESADDDIATIEIGGRARQVRVGDHVPGLGEVLEIQPGPRPLLKTTRGYVLTARDD